MSVRARRGVSDRTYRIAALDARHAAAESDARPLVPTRLLRRVLEGKYTWGELEVWSSRYGYTSFCLVVYPPGSTSHDRIRFRMMRSWPPVGMILGLVAVDIAGHRLPLQAALGIGLGVYFAGALLLALVAGPGRRRVRTLQTCRGDDGTDGFDQGPQARLDEIAELLIENEHKLRAGVIDPAQHEAVWSAAWDQVDAMKRTAA